MIMNAYIRRMFQRHDSTRAQGEVERTGGAFRLIVVACVGMVCSMLWLRLMYWWGQFEVGHFYRLLYDITGERGPWMTTVGSFSFAILSALLFSVLVVYVFVDFYWRRAVVYLGGFFLIQIVNEFFSSRHVGKEPDLLWIAAYLPLWTHMASFIVFSQMLSRQLLKRQVKS